MEGIKNDNFDLFLWGFDDTDLDNGARAAREHDMKRLERAIGIFRKTRKTYKGDTTVYMTMDTDDVAEILGWLEELKEYRAMGA